MTTKTTAENTRNLTIRGIDIHVDMDALDDFELLDMMASLEDGNALQAPRILRRIIGPEYQNVMRALRDPETGRITGDVAVEFIRDLFTGLDPNS